MLILSRHTSEKIILTLEDGRTITIMPVAIRGDKARIGIAAPRGVQIHREEVYNAIQQRAAAKVISRESPAA